MKLSRRIDALPGSATAQVADRIRSLRAAGAHVVDLAIGEPENGPCAAVTAAMERALAAGETRYGATAGFPSLREALAERHRPWTAGNMLVTNGAKQALYALFQVLLDPGDEVVIPAPCWVSFPRQVSLAGGVPVPVRTGRDHRLDTDLIRAAVTPKTRAVLLNSPHNPTGAVYGPEVVGAVAQICETNDLFLIVDAAYEGFLYDGLRPFDLFSVAPMDRVLVVGSFSKRYGMTGLRVGYVAAPLSVIAALEKLQSHQSGNVCTIAQAGALAALSMPETDFEAVRRQYEAKRNLAFEGLRALFPCVRPQGGFYVFADVADRLKAGETAVDFALFLLEKSGVAVVPGEAFGTPGHIRVSFSGSMKTIEEGLRRMAGQA